MSRRLHRATAFGDPSSLPIGNRSAGWAVRSGGGPTWDPGRTMAAGRDEGQQETLRPHAGQARMPFASRAGVRPVRGRPAERPRPMPKRTFRCDWPRPVRRVGPRHVNLWVGSGVGYLREPPLPCGLRPQPRHGCRAEYWRLFP
ncbi:hypothetical protein KCH_24810 [Kitasatospora cheerisanensis KCTC 2395]|uniref:Uncharacterized protein n=1 Tax=Kitasatospora cheerisanensis KCTC 2395 TaxID=1348663 RepID=A0A066YWA1_9ACTN|nr:hypothetical protein KCH_24810 [Kitasatospora cheerisanensis KCTC 2395]